MSATLHPNTTRIAVIGAGTMGSGIAQLAAQAGYATQLYDVNKNSLHQAKARISNNLEGAIKRNKTTEAQAAATLQKITITDSLPTIDAHIVIEAIVEILEIKVKVFNQLAAQLPHTTIFASNTSSIPISRIAAHIPHAERIVGMHFFNPAHIMKLVEVISGAKTAPHIATTISQLAQQMGKTTVNAKDAPGFIVNRVARHFYLEALQLLEENAADVATIDALMEARNFKMGPFRLMDLVGNDINFAVTETLYKSFFQEQRFRPSRLQAQKITAGELGRKTGSGFYKYD